MALRYRNVFSLVVVCLALITAPAFAAKPSAPATEPVETGVPAPDGTTSAAPCVVGQSGPPGFIVKFIFPPDDDYYTLIDPAGCCATGATLLSTAHVTLSWPAPCQLPITVSIVGSTGGACPVPDPNNVICPPTTYVLDGSAGGTITHDLALPAACCISAPAFLKIGFLNSGNCQLDPDGLNAPRLVTDGTADPCVSYNFYPGDPNFRDLVSFYGFPGNPMMYADGDCCQTTPTLPSTWGNVKTLYR